MDPTTLRTYLRARGWSQSELARRVGVSRQAVSLWLRADRPLRVRADHLLRVSQALGVPMEDLLRPLPGQGREQEGLRTALLWDRLYPDVTELALAALRGKPAAVGRLLEVYGLYATAKMLGPSVWRRFAEFAPFVHPARRQQLETLIRWRKSRAAS